MVIIVVVPAQNIMPQGATTARAQAAQAQAPVSVPASGMAQTAAPTLSGKSLVTGNKVSAAVPREGLMKQVKSDSKTTISNNRTSGDTYVNAPNGISPGQLAEFMEMQAG